MQILRNKWWKYLLLSLVDVEANYTVVKAYQYTTLTSIQVSNVYVHVSVCVCVYLCVCICVCLCVCVGLLILLLCLSVSVLAYPLLDCFVIPVLMILSWFFLKTRYRPLHYVSVCVCLLGVGAMVGADLLAGRDQGSSKNPVNSPSNHLWVRCEWVAVTCLLSVPASNILLGDGLVLVSATLYAVSNVCQEYTVKNLSREEFLGMVGLFGTLISGIQL